MKLFYLLLIPMVLAASTGEYCISCHKGKIDLSRLKSKIEWKQLTLDGGKALKKIHKQNLDVVKYIESEKYHKDALYDYVGFFAYGTKEQTAYHNFNQCKNCHDWRIGMSRTKQQWGTLSKSLDWLKELHIGNKEALRLINSNHFKEKKTLSYFIKMISFHATDEQRRKNNVNKTIKVTADINITKPDISSMHQMKNKRFDFHYDAKHMSKEAAKKVFSVLGLKLKTCKKQPHKVSVSLYHAGSKEYASDAIISLIFTLGVAPVRYDNRWIMEVDNGKNVFYSAVNVVSVGGPMSNTKSAEKDKEYIEDKVVFMIDEIMAKPDFRCKK